MKIHVAQSVEALGAAAAEQAAQVVRDCIENQGYARIILATGASQFTFLQEFGSKDLDWSKVEMFHLDEYVGLPESHPASFRKYLKERFLAKVPVTKYHLVNGEGDVTSHLEELAAELREAPIDLALIGIGENGHIAFNDPPADFDTTEAYKVVLLDEACKTQQVREGWFESLDTVPKQAITMTVHQIMLSKTIISCVPHEVKAVAVRNTLAEGIDPSIPASILKNHGDWHLYLDVNSAKLTDLKPYAASM